jgi:hypothetical protein
MPELRRREKILSSEIESLDNHLTSQETYLKLAENLESFLARLRDAATNSSVCQRQQVLRLVVREILVDSDSGQGGGHQLHLHHLHDDLSADGSQFRPTPETDESSCG